MSQVSDYKLEYERGKESFSFINIDFLVETRGAKAKYQEECKKNKKKFNISFEDWLEIKKFEAAKYYIKHSKLNMDHPPTPKTMGAGF